VFFQYSENKKRMLMKKNVNNDVSKDRSIQQAACLGIIIALSRPILNQMK